MGKGTRAPTKHAVAQLAADGASDEQVLSYQGLRPSLLQALDGSGFELKDYNAAKQKYGNSKPCFQQAGFAEFLRRRKAQGPPGAGKGVRGEEGREDSAGARRHP